MDHPQHYQPLSHALNPPPSSYPTTSSFQYEENEDEEDDVQQQLQESPHLVDHSRPPPSTEGPEPKRRPGRPRGSKNRKTRAPVKQETPSAGAIASSSYAVASSTYASAGPSSTPAGYSQAAGSGQVGSSSQFPEVNASNQQYYEFQWRVLNLCAEFYGAAEELVKATPPLVIAQCYQVGPSVKVDPLTLLNNAKAICDSLLANPTRLISNPPPPMYPPAPLFAPSGIITNPGSFTVSMAPASTSYNPPHNAAASSSTSSNQNAPAPIPSSSSSSSAPPGSSNTSTTTAAAAAAAASSYNTFPALPPHPSTSYPPSTFAYATYQHIPGPLPAPGSAPGAHGSGTGAHGSGSGASGSVTVKAPPSSSTPTPTPGGTIAPHQTTNPPSSSTGAISQSTSCNSTNTNSSSRSGWTDEDTDKLRKLAGKCKGEMGEVDWDGVVGGWGGGRSR